jgi:uncharacterized cupin superfamily protein
MAPHPNLVHLDDLPEEVRDLGPLQGRRKRPGDAAGARDAGLSLFTMGPGERAVPVHVHIDEEELFFVLAGSGVSWQDGRTYAIATGDLVCHRADEETHTMVAGPDGLAVLAFGAGSRTGVSHLPRAGTWRLGSRWLPGGPGSPLDREAAAGPLELPDRPEAQRPPTIVATEDVAPTVYDRPGYEGDERDLGRAAGSVNSGLRHVVLRHGALSCPPHWHTAEEELFVVLDGSGEALLGSDVLDVRAGHVLARPPGTGEAHALRGGLEGMTYLAYGTRAPGDLVHYPRSGKLNLGGGVCVRAEVVDFWDGE